MAYHGRAILDILMIVYVSQGINFHFKNQIELQKHFIVVNFVRGKGSLKSSYNLTLAII